jgi:hypothetical protein
VAAAVVRWAAVGAGMHTATTVPSMSVSTPAKVAAGETTAKLTAGMCPMPTTHVAVTAAPTVAESRLTTRYTGSPSRSQTGECCQRGPTILG